jgi:hypothetical protein
MSETTIEVHVPTRLLQFGFDQNEIQRRITEWLILSLFTEPVFDTRSGAGQHQADP